MLYCILQWYQIDATRQPTKKRQLYECSRNRVHFLIMLHFLYKYLVDWIMFQCYDLYLTSYSFQTMIKRVTQLKCFKKACKILWQRWADHTLPSYLNFKQTVIERKTAGIIYYCVHHICEQISSLNSVCKKTARTLTSRITVHTLVLEAKEN